MCSDEVESIESNEQESSSERINTVKVYQRIYNYLHTKSVIKVIIYTLIHLSFARL